MFRAKMQTALPLSLTFSLTFSLIAACFALFIFQSTAQAEENAYGYFAGGCFWCTEHDFEKLPGVTSVLSGYMGGHVANPRYKQVAGGRSGHYEIVRVAYDPARTSYQALLSAFWRMHDPSDGDGSFCDRGHQYSTAIFYVNEAQKRLAEGAIQALDKAGKLPMKIATKLLPVSTFTKAENYHQNYATRNPVRYKYYRYRCGRDKFINKYWDGDTTLYQSAK